MNLSYFSCFEVQNTLPTNRGGVSDLPKGMGAAHHSLRAALTAQTCLLPDDQGSAGMTQAERKIFAVVRQGLNSAATVKEAGANEVRLHKERPFRRSRLC